MFCSMTDPYQPIEAEKGLARKVLEGLLDSPFHILTKSPLVASLEDAWKLVEAGFEYIADMEGCKLFRKRR